MGVYKKNNKWWIDYYVYGTRIRKPVSKSKGEAEKVLLKIKSDMLMNKYAIPNNEKIKFSEFALRYIRDYSIPSKRSYKSDIHLMKKLVEYFGDMNLDEISNYHWEQYRKVRITEKARYRNDLISTTTVNREGALLRSLLNKAVQWGHLGFNPISKMVMFKEEPKERILTNSEIKMLISLANQPLRNIILVALNTGMRKGEILKLEWNQVNLENGFITVKKTKSSKLRRIPLNNSMISLFREMKMASQYNIYVFQNPKTGSPYTDVKKSWAGLLKRAKINDCRFHDLRHTFATYSLLNGGDIISLKETLGHSEIRTTSRYTKALLEGQRRLVNGFEVSDNLGGLIDFESIKIRTG